MKNSVSVFVLFLFLAASGFAQEGVQISGTVYLGSENTVLHEVQVQIVELKLKTTTDNVGRFVFNGVPPGRYTIATHQEGFRDATQTIDVPAVSRVVADFRLQITGVKEDVTVTASGSEISTFDSLASVSTINSSEIVSRAAVGLGDVLNNEAGVAKRSGGSGNSRPVIRGFDGDRVKVSNDGIGVGSLASQSGDHSEPVDTLAVERIEVVKGPATLLFGSNAIGGVVNAISGHDEGTHPGIRGYFSAIGGTNNGQGAASGGTEYGKGPWMLWVNASRQRTGDYKAGGSFGTVLNTFTRNTTGAIGGGHYWKKAYLTTTYSYYQSRYGIPPDSGQPAPEERSLRVCRGDAKFNFGYNDPDLAITGIKFTVDLSNYRHQEIADGDVGTTFRNKVSSYRAMFEQKKKSKLSGRFGFEGHHRDFSTTGEETLVDGPVTQNAFSVFGLEELSFDRVGLQFGLRIENNRYNPENPTLLDRMFTGFSAAVGAKFDIWEGGLFVANFSHGFRAAALEELYNNGPHDGTLLFEVGNPNLRPEINNGLDLSLRHRNARIKVEANFFYYAFKDFVFLAPTGVIDPDSGFEIAEYLQHNSRFTGTELSLDVTAARYLNVIAGLDYVNAELSTGQPLPRIAPLRARFGLDIHRGNLSVRPEFVAVGRQDRLFTNETPTAGYGTANATASYIISRKHLAHIISLSGYNINNKLYFNHISFIKDISPEIGRGLRASYTVRWF